MIKTSLFFPLLGIALALVLSGCSKEERYTTRISGTWKLQEVVHTTYDALGDEVQTDTRQPDFTVAFFDNEGGLNRCFFQGDSTGGFFDGQFDGVNQQGHWGVISYRMNDESDDRLDFDKLICTVGQLNRYKLEFHYVVTDQNGVLLSSHEFRFRRD